MRGPLGINSSDVVRERMFIAALFIIVLNPFKKWKQPRGSFTENWFHHP